MLLLITLPSEHLYKGIFFFPLVSRDNFCQYFILLIHRGQCQAALFFAVFFKKTTNISEKMEFFTTKFAKEHEDSITINYSMLRFSLALPIRQAQGRLKAPFVVNTNPCQSVFIPVEFGWWFFSCSVPFVTKICKIWEICGPNNFSPC